MLYIDGGEESLMIGGAIESAICKSSEYPNPELIRNYH